MFVISCTQLGTELVAGRKIKPYNRENACPLYYFALITSGASSIRNTGAIYSLTLIMAQTGPRKLQINPCFRWSQQLRTMGKMKQRNIRESTWNKHEVTPFPNREVFQHLKLSADDNEGFDYLPGSKHSPVEFSHQHHEGGTMGIIVIFTLLLRDWDLKTPDYGKDKAGI